MARPSVVRWWLLQAGYSLVCLLPLLLSAPATAGNFAVSPIRLDYDSANRNGAITITNSAETALKVQISLLEWRQDENGQDSYLPSDDLLYFPRLATIAPGTRQLVRVGLRTPATGAQEKSYRLFIEELPENKPLTGTQLAVAVRFGVPLFIKPEKELPRGEIESLTLEKGELRLVVRNSGNVHFKITSISAVAAGRIAAQVSGWYLLPEAKREYRLTVPAKDCTKLHKLDVVVETDRLQLEKSIDVGPAMCSGD